MADIPPGGPQPGSNVLMLLILLIIIGAVASWAWLKNPPDTPSPSATSAPATVPEGEAPPSGR